MKIKISSVEARKFRNTLIKWGKENFSYFSWRKNHSRFHSLIAEILLQRTKAEQVVPVYFRFRKRYGSIKSLADSSEGEVKKIIISLGLHWRAKWIYRLGVHLYTEKHSRIPDNYDELTALPGVGPYVAASYLSLHRNIRAPIIDSNVVRLYSRYFGFDSGPETRRARWLYDIADKITPQKKFKEFNYAILDFTRTICRPKPLCEKCQLIKKCKFYLSDSQIK